MRKKKCFYSVIDESLLILFSIFMVIPSTIKFFEVDFLFGMVWHLDTV